MPEKDRAYLSANHVTKRFAGVLALNDVCVEACAGQCLGLLGINGAGKSTLMNILAGAIIPDSAEIRIGGERVSIKNPTDSQKNRIALIHQEAIVFNHLSVAENIFINQLQRFRRRGRMDYRAMYREAAEILARLECSIEPAKMVENITIGERQMIEIARALSQGAAILLFDEPTSSLTIRERELLFKIIAALKKEGKTLIYITHFIDEVFKTCERVAVMRNGEVSGRGNTEDLTVADIVSMMVGSEVAFHYELSVPNYLQAVLRAENITSAPMVRGVSFELYEGEVLGIWGLLGSGRTELFRALTGLDPIQSGSIGLFREQAGGMVPVPPKELLRECAYVTENRHYDGLFLKMGVDKNMTMPSLNQFLKKGRLSIDQREEQEAARQYIDKLSIKTASSGIPAESLSGGNQQKLIFAKWMLKGKKIFLLDEPTRGVDVGAKFEIHQNILQLAKSGCSVLLISSEIEEITNLSNRVMVLRKGQKVKTLARDETNKQVLMGLCVETEADHYE